MKFSPILLLPFIALTAIGTPTPELKDGLDARTGSIEIDGRQALPTETDNAITGAATDERRTTYAVVNANNVRYRRCPSTSCEAIGQYHRGKSLTLACLTTGDTINGNNYWAKINNGYYISEYYLDYVGGSFLMC